MQKLVSILIPFNKPRSQIFFVRASLLRQQLHKLCWLLLGLAFIHSPYVYAIQMKNTKKSPEVQLIVSELKHLFNESQNKNMQLNKNVHIEIDPTANNMIMSKSDILGNYPSTEMIIVKYLGASRDKKQIGLQFNLVQYSYHAKGQEIPQPKTILKVGESANIKVGSYQMKVTAQLKELA